MREPSFENVLPLVQALVPAMAPLLDRPFALFGHSMGALIGFELTRELRRQGLPAPFHLFVSGRVAPHITLPRRPFHNRTEPDLIDGLREMGGTPREVLENVELMRLLIRILKADFTLNETYVYSDEPPLDCPISSFAGLHDREVSRDHLDAWKIHTTSLFEAETFSGGHFFLNDGNHLIRKIANKLDRTFC